MKFLRPLLVLGTLAAAIFVALIFVIALRPPAPAQAQGTIITVNTDLDEWTGSCADTRCSLREAIAQANSTTGTEPVTITFNGDYVITLVYTSGGIVQSLPSITRNSVRILGDRNGDGTPDVVINGEHLTQTGAMGLWIRADDVLVDGLEIRNVDCLGCWGLDIHGNNGVIRNSRFVSNTTGVLLTNGASGNLITNCLAARNTDDGILVSARFSTEPTVITPAHHNTIAFSSILNNGGKGIIIQRGAHDNVVRNNLIAGNGCYGLHLRGGDGTPADPFSPPTGNQILGNEVRGNGATCSPQAGVVNDRTHAPPGDIPTLAGGYDNLFAGNVITANTGMGIYNIGASPLITGNVIANNTSYGVYNLPDFGGTYSPAQANDDILSIPILKNNTVRNNGTYAIYSLDTAPVDRYTLHTDNDLSQPNGLRVLQVWYGAVEVVTGTVTSPVPISGGISARIVASGTGWLVDLPAYASAVPTYNSGIWGKSDIQYANVGYWVGIREFEVTDGGTLIRHLTHTVQVYLQGVYTGAVRFSWDGLTTTDPISGDVLIPQWVQTGPYGRYQVAEVNFTYDADQDTLPDVVEGSGDTDNDGQPDYLDTDSDNDGIPDSVEGGGDVDGDGMPNYLDSDSDGDGIPDAVEGTGDTDGDGIPDFLDTDSDGDGIPDAAEGTGDVDNDGTPNYLDSDSDGDGIPDAVEGAGDVDNDGTPNYLDSDSDGDGIPDAVEAGNDPQHPRDTDGDGIPDFRDTDSDGDGISDASEYIAGTDYFCNDTTLDTDRDGTPNCRDNDADGDGVPNYLDLDSDGDGTPDAHENYPNPNPPPFGHENVPAWIDPMYRLYLPIVLRNR
ncbi:MAG: right-handed parallel beta-helix repeat-containing protein [Thermoflexales bacterium]|nr:right-handed parallel beta-helix repeat-containing protein [Thermoflexales bacterium]